MSEMQQITHAFLLDDDGILSHLGYWDGSDYIQHPENPYITLVRVGIGEPPDSQIVEFVPFLDYLDEDEGGTLVPSETPPKDGGDPMSLAALYDQ